MKEKEFESLYQYNVVFPMKKSLKKRVCLMRGCGTVLSQYNRGKYCNRHSQEVCAGWRVPGKA